MFNFISRFWWLLTGKYLNPPELYSKHIVSYASTEYGHRYLYLLFPLPGCPEYSVFKLGNELIIYTQNYFDCMLFSTFYRKISVGYDFYLNDAYDEYINGVIHIKIPENSFVTDGDYLDIFKLKT